jgi:hypothetical protein
MPLKEMAASSAILNPKGFSDADPNRVDVEVFLKVLLGIER